MRKYLFFIVTLVTICLSCQASDYSSKHIDWQEATDTLLRQNLDAIINKYSKRLKSKKYSVAIMDIKTGKKVYMRNAEEPFVPASCTKVHTAITAIDSLGLDYEFYTIVHSRGKITDGVLQGKLILETDGDPLMTQLDTLAVALRNYGLKSIEGEISYELLNYAARVSPSRRETRIPIIQRDSATIAKHFENCLAKVGITYIKNLLPDNLPKKKELVYVSHTLREVLAKMLIYSNNHIAESMFFLCGNTLTELNNGTYLCDGSGLSHSNRISAHRLVDMMKKAYGKKYQKYMLEEGLATTTVKERNGTLKRRFNTYPRPIVYAKTGTLPSIGVSTLAGYVFAPNGRIYVFAIMNAGSPVSESHLFQDEICQTLSNNN